MDEQKYYIWSIEHAAWWNPAHRGYTTAKDEAGEYSFEEAIKICNKANYPPGKDVPDEAMVPVQEQ